MLSWDHSKNDNLSMIEGMLQSGGEMGQLIHSLDWTNHALGPLENWPASLRTSLGICLFSRFPILVWWGEDLIMLYNDAYRPILGKDKHPLAMGQRGEDAWKEIWDIIGPMLKGVLEQGKATWSDDQMLPLDRSGFTEECYFTFSYSPIWDESGKVGGVFTAVSETTSRVLNERRLRTLSNLSERTSAAQTVAEACSLAAEALAADSADLPFSLIYLFNAEGTEARLVANTGVEAGEAICPELITADDTSCWPIAEILNGNRCVELKDLKERFVEIPGGPWPEAPHTALMLPIKAAIGDKCVGVLIAGVSPRLAMDDAYAGYFELVASQIYTAIINAQAEEAERQQAEMLAELDRAKVTFFNNISHEFRTPLTLMLGPLEELLSGSTGALNDDQTSSLSVIQRNSRRLLRLVNTLLDFSRIETFRIASVFEPTDLSALTTDLASMFRSAIERAGMRLILNISPLSELIYVDQEMWEKILLNLLSNAFKFTFEGEIEVSLRETDQQVELRVRDTGTGINPEELPRIFERFHRVQGARSRTQEGSGIGLALVYDLVERHGGTVQVTSDVNVGSTFTITIPKGMSHLPQDRIGAERALQSTAMGAAPYVEEALRWLPDSEETETGEAFAVTHSYSLNGDAVGSLATDQGVRIILADDNADMREYLEHLLAAYWQVEIYRDGAEALLAAQADPPDLVLADVMMPKMDGFGLLRALRDNPTTRTVPLILLSARAGEEATIQGLAAGADDYLTKPFSARELIARVRAQLAMSRLRETNTKQMQEVLEHMPFMLVAVNEAQEYIVWNHECERVTGFSAEEMLHNPEAVLKLFPDAAYREKMWAFYRDNQDDNHKWEMELARPDGSKRQTLWWNIASQYPVAGWASWSIGIDISDGKLAEKQAVELAAHQERQRLARDLHDSVTQTLFASASMGESLARVWNKQPERSRQLLDQVVQLNRSALAEMRVLLLELRPEAIYARPMRELLQNLIDAAKGFAEFKAELIVEGRDRILPPEIQMTIYRIAQESINNIIKHSKATEFLVEFTQRPNEIQLRISDNGCGFEEQQVSEGIGLGSMRERAEAVEAGLDVVSQPGKGTAVTVVRAFEMNEAGV